MTTISANGTQPDTYFQLVNEFPLKTIRDDNHLDEALAVVDSLTDRVLDAGEKEYLDVLCTLIEAYEQNLSGCGDSSPVDSLRHLMEANGHTQSDLSRKSGLTKSVVSEILSGHRDITLATARKLAVVYGVGADLFVA